MTLLELIEELEALPSSAATAQVEVRRGYDEAQIVKIDYNSGVVVIQIEPEDEDETNEDEDKDDD